MCFLLFSIIPLALTANAQIMQYTDAPAVGDQMRYVQLDADPLFSSGSGQQWVILGSIDDTNDLISFVPVAGAPGALNYPLATIAAVVEGQDGAAYFRSTPSGLELLGTYTTPGPPWIYTDTDRWLPYPCSMGTTWTDGYTLLEGVGGDTIDHVAPSVWLADGTGSLTGPNGTLQGVLKCRTTRNSTFEIAGDLAQVTTVIDRFWKPGYPIYVGEVRRSIYEVPGQDPFFSTTVELLDELAIGTEEHHLSDIGVEVYPNPAHAELQVVFADEGPVTLRVLDGIGREVMAPQSLTGQPGISRADIDLSELSVGRYLVRLTNEQGQQGCRAFVRE
jgi:Secretion system C-terminal sorting domain